MLALVLDEHFGALLASIQVLGELWTSSFKVLDCFCVRRRALTRAAGFPARFDGCHLYLLVNVAQYYLLVQNLQNNICKTC